MLVQRRGIIEITNFGFGNPKKIPLNRLYKMGGHPHLVYKNSLSGLPLLVKKLAHTVFILFYKIQKLAHEFASTIRAVHRLGRVGFRPNPDSTCRRRVEGRRNPKPTTGKIGRFDFG